MRFLHYPLLASALMFLVAGCGQEAAPRQNGIAKHDRSAASSADRDMGSDSSESEYFASEAKSVEFAPSEMPTSAAEPEAPAPLDGFPLHGREESLASRPKPASVNARRHSKGEVMEKLDVAKERIEETRRELERQKQRQAGTLTAGSLNDHKNLEDYRDYLSQTQQSEAGSVLPINIGQLVMIEVQDEEGNGVPSAQVTITQLGKVQDNSEGVLLDTWTRADGRTFFSSGLDNPTYAKSFELTVRAPGGKPMVQQVSLSQSPWVVKVPNLKRELPKQLDLALVVDTTSSMSDELEYLKVEIDQIAHTVSKMYPGVDQRYSLIVYRDETDAYVRRVFDFTDSLEKFRENLSAQSAYGGGDHPEAMHVALEAAKDLSWRGGNTARVMFLVADASPHRQHIGRTIEAVEELRHKSVAVYPLASSGIRPEFEYLMRASAFLTRGRYLFLTDHSGVGNAHAKPQAPKYEVEPLKQLMVRMIATELAGKEVLAQEVIATEQSDGSDPVYPQDQNQSANDPATHPVNSGHSEPVTVACYGPDPQRDSVWESLWESTTVRILAGLVIIAGIMAVDHRMRT
ncbi:MAG: VWA domain-containing protein, partial [Planctomycetaceae bacterium]|nr:VWA domain-containing protein [Planctomycetaceae bacterium]